MSDHNKPRHYAEDNIEEAHKEHITKYKMAHMIGVAEYMRERAMDYSLSPDVAYTVGLLHDIGYLQGRANHERIGADLLSEMRLDEEYVKAIRFHGDNPYKLREEFGGNDFVTPEYLLLLEADMSIDARGFRVGFDARVADIERRYGNEHPAFETVQDNVRFLRDCWKQLGISEPKALYNKEDDKDNLPNALKCFGYVSRVENGKFDECSLFANVVDDDMESVTLNRFKRYGKLAIGEITISRDDFNKYYEPASEYRSKENEHKKRSHKEDR